jgi:hypothetical protein
MLLIVRCYNKVEYQISPYDFQFHQKSRIQNSMIRKAMYEPWWGFSSN